MTDDLIERLRELADAWTRRTLQLAACDRQNVVLLNEAADALEAAREDACVALVADIRFACGDNGKRMQPELVEFIRELAADAERLDWLDTQRGDDVRQCPRTGDPELVAHYWAIEGQCYDVRTAIDAARKEARNG